MKVKCCLKCKEYVPIHTENPHSYEMIKSFDKKHRYHNTIIIPKTEMKGEYKIYEMKREEKDNEKDIKE